MNPPASNVKRGTPIGWDEIRRRLDAAREIVDRGWKPHPREARRILRSRALLLAREPADKQPADALRVLDFMLAHEKWAVELRFVREVQPLTSLTPVPCTPEFISGIINLRGEILSVIDIKRFFELPDKPLTDLDKVLVLQSDAISLGVLADQISGVRSISTSEIHPSLPTLTGIREKYLKGVTSEQTVILDAARLLADETLIVQESVEG